MLEPTGHYFICPSSILPAKQRSESNVCGITSYLQTSGKFFWLTQHQGGHIDEGILENIILRLLKMI